MQITSLAIKGFRNLGPLHLDLQNDPNVIVLVGKNGQGKTNILEAIYLCALSKSFRTNKNHELIAFDQEFCTIQAQTKEQAIDVVVTREPLQKVLKINGLKKSALDFVGCLKTVYFSPDDLAHMAFAPRLRRRYLDVVLSQLNPHYLNSLTQYESARKRRNALLKRLKTEGGHPDELHFWDELLAEHALYILEERKTIIAQIMPLLLKYYNAIAKADEKVEISYLSEVASIESKSKYLDQLIGCYEMDIASGKTSIGPQRDDLRFSLGGHDMQSFSSRGEWRSLVLALKFAEIELLKQKTGENPILLLDDVFSELDEGRQHYLLQALGDIQTFITTTHAEFLSSVSPQIYRVENGSITK